MAIVRGAIRAEVRTIVAEVVREEIERRWPRSTGTAVTDMSVVSFNAARHIVRCSHSTLARALARGRVAGQLVPPLGAGHGRWSIDRASLLAWAAQRQGR